MACKNKGQPGGSHIHIGLLQYPQSAGITLCETLALKRLAERIGCAAWYPNVGPWSMNDGHEWPRYTRSQFLCCAEECYGTRFDLLVGG